MKYDNNGTLMKINNIMFNNVPAVLYQVNSSRKIKNITKKQIFKNLEENPEFDYYMYNNYDCREYIKKHFSKNVLNAYNTLELINLHTELWKYCILYNNGGVYLDIDYNINISLSNYIQTHPIAFVNSYTNPFIIAPPKLTIFKIAIDNIVNNIDNINTESDLDNISLINIIYNENMSDVINMYIDNKKTIKDIETNTIICSL
jgi:mannosyltransferase OCH1-like enzyme